MSKKTDKSFKDRKKIEVQLSNELQNLQRLSSFLNICMKGDAKSNKYKIAKKRYGDLLDKVSSDLDLLKDIVEQQEKTLKKDQTREKLRKADEEVYKTD
jgi:hypothetical protein